MDGHLVGDINELYIIQSQHAGYDPRMVAIADPGITAAECARLLDYNPRTGALTWPERITPKSRGVPGAEAGSIHRDGYRYIRLKGRQYLASRLAWLMTFAEWPDHFIDHENRDRADNRLANLRIASPTLNSRNTSSRRGASSRFLGVTWNKNSRKWQASIATKRRVRYLGLFDREEDAAAAYRAAVAERDGL